MTQRTTAILLPYTGQSVLAKIPSKVLENFVGAKFYCLHARANGNQCIWIGRRHRNLPHWCYLHHHHNVRRPTQLTELCCYCRSNCTTTVLQLFFWDHPGEPVPEENFWTLWYKGRLTEADTPTIWLDATPSGITSAHLHHPPIFYRLDALPAAQPTVSKL